MQVVSTVVRRQDSRGVARVAHHCVEIDGSIEFFAVEYPGVDLLTHGFFIESKEGDLAELGILEKRLLEGWVGCPNDSNSILVGARYKLAIGGYDAFGTHAFG